MKAALYLRLSSNQQYKLNQITQSFYKSAVSPQAISLMRLTAAPCIWSYNIFILLTCSTLLSLICPLVTFCRKSICILSLVFNSPVVSNMPGPNVVAMVSAYSDQERAGSNTANSHLSMCSPTNSFSVPGNIDNCVPCYMTKELMSTAHFNISFRNSAFRSCFLRAMFCSARLLFSFISFAFSFIVVCASLKVASDRSNVPQATIASGNQVHLNSMSNSQLKRSMLINKKNPDHQNEEGKNSFFSMPKLYHMNWISGIA